MQRKVILGRNSKIWKSISVNEDLNLEDIKVISHASLDNFDFTQEDIVFVFSYSVIEKQNEELLEKLKNSDVKKIIYVNSATTNILPMTNCYRYPSVKYEASNYAYEVCGATILTIGVSYKSLEELPSGGVLATSEKNLIRFINHPVNVGQENHEVRLMEFIEKKFDNLWESRLYSLYGQLMNLVSFYPCLLRPFDLILKGLGYRWYGYLYLSNQLWRKKNVR